MVAEYYSGGGVPPSNHHHHHHKDVRLHLALFAIQCVCAIYNTLCQLFLSKNDESKDDWRAVLVFSLYRDVLAAPLLYVCAFLHDSHQQHVSGGVSSNFRWFPSSQDFPRVLSQAFLGIFCNQLASLLGIQLVGAVMASLVHLATPMCAMAIAVYLGQEKLNAFIASGVVVACVGAMSMSAIDAYLKDVSVEEEKKESSPVGLFALFAGSLASAVYYNLQKITLKKKENVPLMVTAWEYAFGASMMALCAVICVPFGNEAEVYAYDGENSVSSIAANAITSGGRSAANKRWVLETEGLYALFFAVVFNSILKYALSAYCNKRAGVTLLTVYSTLQPVVTAVLALLLLSQPLRWGYVGAFAIFYGVWLVAKGRDLNATSGKMKYDDSAPTTTSTTISTSNTNNTRNKKEEQPYSSLSNSKELRETNSTANFPPFLARDDGCYCRQCPPDDYSPVSSSSASFDEGENKENFGLDSPPKKKPNPLSKEKRERYLSWDDYFMTVAFLSSQRSKDPNKQVGAVIASESKLILGVGYNGFPRGCGDDALPWAKKSPTGDPLETKYAYVCHAEMNAIMNKNSADVKNGTMYVTMYPCNECAKLMIQAGIREVVYCEGKLNKDDRDNNSNKNSASKNNNNNNNNNSKKVFGENAKNIIDGAAVATTAAEKKEEKKVDPSYFASQKLLALAGVTVRQFEPKVKVDLTYLRD
ncbi:deoxycytidylate deaminase [Bathycoccus prasinos]|uniref:dCMP deaminase n=1 Tax=Bathycoccus prasinos TaxID=41875 RepID=K8EGW4_9CHLO|nr:deoxycytidylate deaminase [Bathycoccus prasinos]CCO17377.1 deoxycytidylate deaminase [Bathycoccus prasinos]|eukprot:XP_007512777.1 deoxycytidylate deaminase [Bathycoccus prasinos]